jgi:DNA (cytosine-5)-methyltransferase 1
MSTYYNDNDAYCCKVLQKNVERGNLPKGKIDGRDIRDVQATDLDGYQHIHLFAGIGGFPLGFQLAGVPDTIRVLTGGFPCQDISSAGKRAGIMGERSGLWGEMHRLICAIRPDYVAIENVAALVGRGLSTVLGDLAQGGYDAEWQIISAASVGAPHLRERIFILAYPNSDEPPVATQTRGDSETSEKTSPERVCGDVAHSISNGLQANQQQPGLLQEESSGGVLQSRLRSGPVFRGPIPRWSLWANEPAVDRVADGVPARVDRLRGLGNAIVPQITEYIGRCIVAHAQAA